MEQPETPPSTTNTTDASPNPEMKIILLGELILSLNQRTFYKEQEIVNKQRREELAKKKANLTTKLTDEEIEYYTKQLQMLDNSIEYQRKCNENKKQLSWISKAAKKLSYKILNCKISRYIISNREFCCVVSKKNVFPPFAEI